MPEAELHRWIVWAHLALGAITFVAVSLVKAPYGRHVRPGFGPTMPQRLAWVVMEVPAVVVWGAIYALGDHAAELVPLVLLGAWQVHYLQRTFFFPFRFENRKKRAPIAVVASAVMFNVLNAYVVARWVSHFGSYAPGWLADPRFLLGALLFALGLAANIHSDGVLARLRAPGEVGYKIPQGGLFRFVSCPNYLAEIAEWLGFALMTWSLAGAAFAFYTFANLAPRAIAHHRWYKEQFPDYPRERRALVPFLV